MGLVYCSRCGRVIPPGGVDDGLYYQRGESAICIKCYKAIPEEERTGDTVATLPVERKAASRIMPAVHRPASSSALTPAVKKQPTTRVLPAVKGQGGSRRSSAKLRRMRAPAAAWQIWLAVLVVLLIIAGLVLIVMRSH